MVHGLLFFFLAYDLILALFTWGDQSDEILLTSNVIEHYFESGFLVHTVYPM